MSWKTVVRQHCPKQSDRILATAVSIYSVPGTVCLSAAYIWIGFNYDNNLSGSLLLASFHQEKKFSSVIRSGNNWQSQDSNPGLTAFRTRALNSSVILPWMCCFRHECGQKSDRMGPWSETVVKKGTLKKNEKKAIC